MATGCRFRPDCRKIREQPIASAIQLRIGLFQPKPFTSLFANLGGVRLRFFECRNHDADNVALACADATANSSIPDTVARIDEPFFAERPSAAAAATAAGGAGGNGIPRRDEAVFFFLSWSR
jgi:hypothetical protein